MNAASSVRYRLEQHDLPNLFFRNSASFLLKMMGTQGKAIMDLYRQAEAKNRNYRCPYSEEEFLQSHTVYHDQSDDALILRIQMPEPEHPALSRAIYLCYAQKSSDQLLFTSEKAEKDGDYELYAWTSKGAHLSFGVAPKTAKEEFRLVARQFMGRRSIRLPEFSPLF